MDLRRKLIGFNSNGWHALLIMLVWVSVSIVAGWLGVFMVPAVGEIPLRYIIYRVALQGALWAVAFPLIVVGVRRFSLDQGFRVRSILAQAGIALAVCWFTSVGYASILSWIRGSNYPLQSLFPALRAFTLFRFMQINLLFSVLLILNLQAWRIWKDFQKERTRTLELEGQLAISQLEALRMQLQPHFLLNTLHTIASLVRDQPATARRMLVALGDLLRPSLTPNTSPTRSLGEELEFCDLYMGIETLRLGDRLVLSYHIKPESTKAQVPYLLLQPLFENAVKHGAARMSSSCEITLRASQEGQRLNISLQNDGPCLSSDQPTLGVGLKNTLERLRLHYGQDFTFQFASRPEGGAKVDISFPRQERIQ